MAPSAERKGSGDSAGAPHPHPGKEVGHVAPTHEEGFGDKSIGFWGSVCLLANNITGPGMVQIPVLFQQAGWLVPTIFFGYIGILAGLTSLFLAKAVSQVPGNSDLSRRMEFSNLAKLLFPRWLYLLTLFALIFNFQVTNMSSIVVSAQTMDSTLLAAARKTCALVIYDPDGSLVGLPNGGPNGTFLPGVASSVSGPFACVDADTDSIVTDSPFGSAYVVSIGYLVTMAITVPLGYLNLDDNIWVQYGGFVLLLACIIAWVAQFLVLGLDFSRMPTVSAPGLGGVIPTVVFNWGFLTTLPSWLNEKNPNVSVAKATWVSIVISGVMFMLLGILGALALDYPNGEDLLAALNTPGVSNIFLASKIATYVFPSAALLSGIPVFSIIIRYNLLENKIVNKFWANMFAVVFPWAVSVAFYAGNSLATLINWSSAILFVALNFLLPLMLYTGLNTEKGREHMVRRMREEGLFHEPGEEGVVAEAGAGAAENKKEAAKGAKAAEIGSIQSGSKAAAKADGDGIWGFSPGTSKMLRFVASSNIEMSSSSSTTSGAGAGDEAKQSLLSALEREGGAVAGDPAHGGAHLDKDGPVHAEDVDWEGSPDIDALPSWWCRCCGRETEHTTASVWLWSTAFIAVVCFILQVVATADPNFADSA